MSQREEQQKLVCLRFKTDFVPSSADLKLGISLSAQQGILPLNGLRHPIKDGTSGWYIWGGENFSNDPDFFEPVHIKHLQKQCPKILKYLGLPPGWRFLISENYEDVWFDESLLAL